jgi:hypothetical protein
MNRSLITFFLLVTANVISFAQKDVPKLTGPYLGQKQPGMTPKIFAQGIVSTRDHFELGCSFSPDGKEFYFARTDSPSWDSGGSIMSSYIKNGRWTVPEKISFTSRFVDTSPHVTYDGKKMFLNRFHRSDTNIPSGIWFSNRTNDQWDRPQFLCPGTYPTTTTDGTLYFAHYSETGDRALFKSKYVNGKYLEPDILGGEINTPYFENHPFIAPDESYVIFDSDRDCAHPGTQEKVDLYICFRNQNGSWGKVVLFGDTLGNKYKNCAYVSPDGKFLFFASEGNIYWVDAKIIEQFRQKG